MTLRAIALFVLTLATGTAGTAQQLLLEGDKALDAGSPRSVEASEAAGETFLSLDGSLAARDLPMLESDKTARGRQTSVNVSATAGPDTVGDMLVPMRAHTPPMLDSSVAEFVGEWAQRDFRFTIPQIPGGAAVFRFTHQSSANALPDSSFFRIEINGTVAQELPLDSFEGFRTDSFEIDPELLRTGDNRVRISVRQTHRIYCGVEAAFQLWTRVDMSQTGIVLPDGIFQRDFESFIARLAIHAARGQSVPVRHNLDAPIADRITPLFSALRNALKGDILLLEEQSPWQVGLGKENAARISIIDDRRVNGVSFQRGGDGAQVMVIGARMDFNEVAEALRGMSLGTALAPPVPKLVPGNATQLAELTEIDLVGHGRYVAMPVNFRLPNDWMLLANQKARLNLDYRFAPALPRGALLQVKINSKTVRLLPLDRKNGNTLPTLPISVPANMLRPGQNTLLFEALIPGDPSHAPCPSISTPLVEILGTSELYVPPSPRMSVLDLDHALSVLDASDVLLTEAAHQMLDSGAHVMLASTFSSGPAARLESPSPKLTVGVPADIYLVSPFYSNAAIQAMQNAMRSLPAPAPQAQADPWGGVNGGTDDSLKMGMMRLLSQLQTGFLSFSGETYTSTSELPSWLQTRSAEAVLIQPDPAHPERVWLFVNPQTDLRMLATSLANRLYGTDGPRGQIAVYSSATGWQNWSTTAKVLHLLEPLTPSNFLAVAGNFATAFPWIFVFLLILIAFAASVVSAVLVLNRRRDNA